MKQTIISQFKLTPSEVDYLDFHYGSAWATKAPAMYINLMRRANEVYYCSECCCEISEDQKEDYGMCERCYENWRD